MATTPQELWPGIDGEMAERCRAFDWSSTPLGPVERWPPALTFAVGLMLSHPLVATVVAGSPRILLYNDAAARLYGDRHPAALGRPLIETFPEAEAVVPHYDQAFSGESLIVRDQPLDLSELEDGGVFDAFLVPVRDEQGQVTAVMMTGIEVGERNRAEQALRQSEQRYRNIVHNARYASIFTTDEQMRVTDWHDGAQLAFGYTPEEILGQDARILWTPEDRAKGAPENEAAVAAEEGKADDVRWHLRKDGSRVFIDGVSTALRDTRGRLTGFLKIGLDATDRRRAEEYERTLVHELQHRVRNILAMIRSVARRTAQGADGTDDYLEHFEGRLSAMARVQAIITRQPDAGVNLRDLLLEEIEAQSLNARRFAISGPEVQLASKAAEVLSLAIHELSTNSIKYGVMAAGDGEVAIAWRVAPRDGEQWLDLRWSEPLVGDVQHDRHEGFGTELITRRVPYELRGAGEMDIGPETVNARIQFPLTKQRSLLDPELPKEVLHG